MNTLLKSNRWKAMLRDCELTFFAIVFALVVGGIFLRCIGTSPVYVYGVMVQKALSSFDSVLRRAMVLMLTGLAVAIPLHSGMFNMGGEGQVAAGALAAAVVGSMNLGLPRGVHLLAALLAAVLVGMVLAGLPALLSIRFGASEVVVTLMLNNILSYIITWLVMNPFRGSEFSPQTADVLETARIPSFGKGIDFSWGLVIAVLLCVLTAFFLQRTTGGLKLKAAGLNALVARYQGVQVAAYGLLGMVLGGAAAAAGGALEVLGGCYAYKDEYFLQYGFDGIAIAYMVRNNPVGIIFSAIFISVIRTGALVVSRKAGISTYFVSVLQGLMIIFLVTPAFSEDLIRGVKKLLRRCGGKKEAAV